jgi:hypothetical protein
MPFCTCSTPYSLVTHIVSSPEECRRLENILKSKEPGSVECRYEEEFLEPL